MRGLHVDALSLDLIAKHTRGLADIADEHPGETPVATCGEWTLDELAFHLYEVQHFWVHIIEHRPAGPETYERPEQPADLAHTLRAIGGRLVDLLASADPADTAWSWSSDHTVGFTIRRQLHEALVHHVDGLLAIGADLPEVAPKVGADGVDELVGVMMTDIPDWATFFPSAEFARLEATDTGDAWTLSLGHVSGTSTQTGVTYNGLPAANRVEDTIRPDLTIAGPSLDLLLWMWGRASASSLSLTGEAEIADSVRELVVTATQ